MVITERDWQSALNKNNWKNPILKGQRYLEYLNSNPDFSYKDVAHEFGVSKARVSQMVALIKKLPSEILDCFHMEYNSESIGFFTERKLRPLTLMDSDKEKLNKFWAMI